MKQRIVIDVRTPSEFSSGHIPGSINIPLQEFQSRWKEIPKSEKPIILCCASGNRSGAAAKFLAGKGVLCENGGAWTDVDARIRSERNTSHAR